MAMTDLSCVDSEQFQKFLDSFDFFFSDIDGVFWNFDGVIPKVPNAIKNLQKLGKRVIAVTNNSLHSIPDLHKTLSRKSYDIDVNDIMTPILACVDFLKQKAFTGRILLLGMMPLKRALEDAGFEVVLCTSIVAENMIQFIEKTSSGKIEELENISAVIVDVDLTISYSHLQKIFYVLQNKDVLFLTGVTDREAPPVSGTRILAPGIFTDLLKTVSGKEGISFSKPGVHFGRFCLKNYKIQNPERVLFVGDSVPADMGVASCCGFQKLLVLSGVTHRKDLEGWNYDEKLKPDYVIDDLGKLFHD